jgi:hypothetical protein
MFTLDSLLKELGYRKTSDLTFSAFNPSAFDGAKAYKKDDSVIVTFPDGDWDVDSVFYGNGPEELAAKLALRESLN